MNNNYTYSKWYTKEFNGDYAKYQSLKYFNKVLANEKIGMATRELKNGLYIVSYNYKVYNK